MRQVQLQRLPVITVIERNPHRSFSSSKEQALADGILANCIDRRIRQAVCDQLPGLATIVRSVDVGSEVVDPKAADRGIGRVLVKMRSLNLGYLAPRCQLWRRDIAPILPAIMRDPDPSVVCPCPEGIYIVERGSQSINHTSLFHRVRIFREHGTDAGWNTRLWAREVGANGLP